MDESKFENLQRFVLKAIEFDKAGKNDAAVYYYGQAAELLLAQCVGKPPENEERLRAKATEYIKRAERLKFSPTEANLQTTGRINEQNVASERVYFLISQAMNEDEAANVTEACDLYFQAAELCLQIRAKTNDMKLSKKLEQLAKDSMDRIEKLKNQNTSEVVPSQGGKPEATNRNSLQDEARDASKLPDKVSNKDTSAYLSKEELEVLRRTSYINTIECLPFLDIDLKERFGYPLPFSDKNGLLPLSEKQKRRFLKWVRPSEFMERPSIIDRIDSGTIKQTIISDCSFIASLAVAARYERRFGKSLISRIIFPQNRNHQPVYNPCGKYMIKLYLNGVHRKVIIDDYLPMGQHGELLCSYSQSSNELWVSLLEKAYMKVMGGYDFPGSNSNIDLNALTTWIPDRIALSRDSATFNKDQTFNLIFTHYHKGDCLATMATGNLPPREQETSGLIKGHAYAMLDIRQFQGKRLFLLKNPWTHIRWKGRFSDRDLNSWTLELRKALDYDPNDAQQFDNGVFWIEYDSLCNFFDVIYLNWNPEMFPFSYCLHSLWNAGVGPSKDLYTIGTNPQFSLELLNKSDTAAVWILLTRHITEKSDFAQNKEFITLLVYKGDGKKIYYPVDPPPYIDGVRINSPHYLCKMKLDRSSSDRYTLVVSQYEKTKTIFFTLRVYSSCRFRLSRIIENFSYKDKKTGEWKGKTAGGCPNYHDTYRNNPVFQFSAEVSIDELLIELRGPKLYSVGFDVEQIKSSQGHKPFSRSSTGAYRPGFCILRLSDVPAGVYNIVPTTFFPGQEGPFFLDMSASSAFVLKRIQ